MAEPLIVTSPEKMRDFSLEVRSGDRSLGFVPTMGALHQGHQSLIRRACSENDVTAVSIFVNPTQFGSGEDFGSYPRQMDADLKLCAAEGTNVIFAPEAADMYPRGAGFSFVEPGPMANRLEGISRPGHFRGVCTVVAKLFNIVLPDRAYFGQKDAQQAAIIDQMIRDLNFGVRLVLCPTVREPDGLAMSSRNSYLKPKERQAALRLYRALEIAHRMTTLGETKATEVAAAMAEEIVVEPLCDLDYAAVVDPRTFEDVEMLEGPALAALAVRVGRARLIDNAFLEPSREAGEKKGRGRGKGR